METKNRTDLINLYKNGPELLDSCLQSIPGEALEYKAGPDRWSIHEIVVHIIDSDINSFLRFRKAIAEPGDNVPVYDENQWIKKLFSPKMEIPFLLELLHVYRRYTGILLDTVGEDAWIGRIIHPENGEMTLDDVLNLYAAHIPVHIRQIQNTVDAWNTSRKGEYVDPDKSLI
jgi:DinB superfamily